MNKIIKMCKKHGELTIEQVREEKTKSGYQTFRCYLCKVEKDRRWKENNREQHIAASIKWKKENKDHVNNWRREDRKNDPNKYSRYKKNTILNKGIEEHRRLEVCRNHGITKEKHELLIQSQKNLCAICNKSETRKGRSGDIAPLCIDHCHYCESKGNHMVRGLLCHACNTALGKFKDDITLLQKAIIYLEKHIHIK